KSVGKKPRMTAGKTAQRRGCRTTNTRKGPQAVRVRPPHKKPTGRYGREGKKKKNKEMTKKTKILVPHGVVSQMERERYGSRPTIRKALRHDYNEQNDEERNRALRIRRRAMQLGGVAEQNAKED
ncbi:MAG: hypothetical protein IK032_07765, partial [Bacteroidales bacterium]|nr:hypothetical protein [Bacteroidales bacterium]